MGHVLPVLWLPPGRQPSPHVAAKPHWDFDGNLALPTFAPSILSRTGHYVDRVQAADCLDCQEAAAGGDRSMCGICHSFVRAGRIEFLADCTHELAGQTVDLPELGELV